MNELRAAAWEGPFPARLPASQARLSGAKISVFCVTLAQSLTTRNPDLSHLTYASLCLMCVQKFPFHSAWTFLGLSWPRVPTVQLFLHQILITAIRLNTLDIDSLIRMWWGCHSISDWVLNVVSFWLKPIHTAWEGRCCWGLCLLLQASVLKGSCLIRAPPTST